LRRFIMLVALTAVMLAMVLANALPALAAPPEVSVACTTPPFNGADATIDPKEYRDLNALYRNCKSVGGSPTREVIPIPGPASP
jgi:hypothetical protein